MSNDNTQTTQKTEKTNAPAHKVEWHKRVDHVRRVIGYIAKQAQFSDSLMGVAERLEQEFEVLVDNLAENERIDDSVKAGAANEFEALHVAEHELTALRQFLTYVTESHEFASEIALAYGAEVLKVIRDSFEDSSGEVVQTNLQFAIYKGRTLRWSIGNFIEKKYAERRQKEEAKHAKRRQEKAFEVYNRVSDELVERFGISPIRVNGRLADEDTPTDKIWEQTNRLSEALIDQFLGWAKSVNNPENELLAQIAQAENEEEKMGRRVYAARGAFFEAQRILSPDREKRRQQGGGYQYGGRQSANKATQVGEGSGSKKQRQRQAKAKKQAKMDRDASAVPGLSS